MLKLRYTKSFKKKKCHEIYNLEIYIYFHVFCDGLCIYINVLFKNRYKLSLPLVFFINFFH